MDHYRVKFTRANKIIFGIVDSYSKEAKAAAVNGKCIVEDAVLPKRYIVNETELIDIPLSVENLQNGDEYDKFINTAFDEAQTTSNELPDEGVHVGSMFSIGVGDGQAWYVVVKVNKKTCQVEWRGFCQDRWTDHHFGYGGRFPINDVSRYVEGAKAMARIFAKKTG
jgi:hypothetical protein